jgi:murein L,D-transpeptidase YcbB/YkuD
MRDLTVIGRSLALAAVLAFQAPALAQEARPDCHSCEQVAVFYEARGDLLAWTGPGHAARYLALIEAIRDADSHGLDPQDYHLDWLTAGNPYRSDRALDEVATDAYLMLAAHLEFGRLDPVTVEPNWSAAHPETDLAAYLETALSSGSVRASLEALAPSNREYQALRDALALYRALAETGPWPAIEDGPLLHPGDTDPRVPSLRARLIPALPTLPEEEADARSADAPDPQLYDEALAEAVRAFQARSALEADGLVGGRTLAMLNMTPDERIDRLRVNLERWRWLPHDFGRRHIRVNIAGFKLEAFGENGIERRHKVIIGCTYRRTPVFSGAITYLVLNPWWETPHSLAVRDKLPSFRRDPGRVERLGFQVLDEDGQEVDPNTIDWDEVSASDFPYRLRQAPGPLNALGQVKFIFPNPHSVYLHDTPDQDLFEHTRRAFSSGCIRVHDAVSLAGWALSETPDWTEAEIAEVLEGGLETPVPLAERLPVHVLYFTIEAAPGGGLRFLDDLYERDGGVLAALDEGPPPLE